MTKLNVLDWNKTSWPKKFARMIVVGAVHIANYKLFGYLIKISNNSAEIFFYRAISYLLSGYFIYGPLVLFMSKCGLIDKKNHHFH